MTLTSLIEHPDLPDYEGACVVNVVPALLEPGPESPSWLPSVAASADQVVLLLIDGLGWEQLQARRHVAPTLASMQGSFVHTVAPSTTAAALTSITTGTPPGVHGVIGYRVVESGEVLNILRWSTQHGDARKAMAPERFQPVEPFLGHRPPIVTRTEFNGSGFTRAHLRDARPHGYRVRSSMAVEVKHLLDTGEPFIYAYYEGLDKIAHEQGFGEHYDAELASVDRLVADLIAVLPRGAAVLVTADHGQVEVGDRVVPLQRDLVKHLSMQSGEGRFRWLHARSGRVSQVLAAAEAHADVAWVVTREEVVDGGWFGPKVSDDAIRRLGDVALVARADVSFYDALDTGPFSLVGRHGSLTAAEMRVPLIAASS